MFDTSFSMKSHFDDMWQWAGDYAANNRYTRIVVGTDKQEIGEYNTRLSQGVVLKSAFGKFSSESLDKYKAVRNDKKILLSNGEVTPENWELIVFR